MTAALLLATLLPALRPCNYENILNSDYNLDITNNQHVSIASLKIDIQNGFNFFRFLLLNPTTLLTSFTVSGLLTEKCYMNSKFRRYCSLKRKLTNPISDEVIKSDCAL